MRRPDPGLREQGTVRSVLRIGGPIVFGIGVLLTAAAMIDFFSAMGSMTMPSRFWMGFLGLPMLAVGWGMIQAGYLGPATRYVAGEVAPTLRDSIGALGFGSDVSCAGCGARNTSSALFCAACGRAMATACSACGAENDGDARFCNRCGKALARA